MLSQRESRMVSNTLRFCCKTMREYLVSSLVGRKWLRRDLHCSILTKQLGPCFGIDHADQTTKLCRVLHSVLCLAKDHAEHARNLAEILQRVAVLNLQGVAFDIAEC